ncbi:DUF58 domain-containing protein [Massilia sp. W12]|uniref:DUF58 domain-containing protein n=1 Tax=Massilia sp. W12 TaxID=3126507 RepID=UPI0030D5A1A5
MIPSALLLRLCGALIALAIPLYWLPWAAPGWYALLALLCGGALFDAIMARRQPQLEIEREAPGVWAVGRWHDVFMVLHNRDTRSLRLELFDHYPSGWEINGQPSKHWIAPGHYIKSNYRLRPAQRGDARFEAPELRLYSPLGLWQKIWRIGAPQEVKVFPDYAQLFGRHLALTELRSNSAGHIRKRRRGEGTDFRQLREYRDGDSERAIDWKASARQQKLITREYQEERDQQVMILLDTGRRMLAKDGLTSHFDHALHAVLSLAFIAQRQGDGVGLMTFGGELRYLAPQKGRAGLDRLMAHTYDLQAEEVAPDYLLAATHLMERLKKRAFVVLITNLRDEDDEVMRSAVRLISSRHLVICASLREQALDMASHEEVESFDQALRHCASLLYQNQRMDAIRKLGLNSSQLLDVTPHQLATALIRHYMDIKESGRL